jgi:hypothetical protein
MFHVLAVQAVLYHIRDKSNVLYTLFYIMLGTKQCVVQAVLYHIRDKSIVLYKRFFNMLGTKANVLYKLFYIMLGTKALCCTSGSLTC